MGDRHRLPARRLGRELTGAEKDELRDNRRPAIFEATIDTLHGAPQTLKLMADIRADNVERWPQGG